MSKLLRMVPFLLALLLLGAIFYWAPVCKGTLQLANGNEVAMRCFYTGRGGIILALLLLIMGIQDLLHKKTSYLFYIVSGAILFLLPNSSWGIGVCKKEAMACITTALWIKGVGIGSVLYGMAALLKKDDGQVPD